MMLQIDNFHHAVIAEKNALRWSAISVKNNATLACGLLGQAAARRRSQIPAIPSRQVARQLLPRANNRVRVVSRSELVQHAAGVQSAESR